MKIKYDPMFVARIAALIAGLIALGYITCVQAYHFGPSISSPVDLHVNVENAFEEKMKKEEPELVRKKNYDRSYDSKDCEDSTYHNDPGYHSDHGRDYQ